MGDGRTYICACSRFNICNVIHAFRAGTKIGWPYMLAVLLFMSHAVFIDQSITRGS